MKPNSQVFNTLLVFLTVSLSSVGLAQVVPIPDTSFNFEKEDFRTILRFQFSKVITGNTYSNIGSFAKVSTDNNQVKVGATFVQNKNSLITGEVAAGALEGVAGLFTNGKLNSNVSINFAKHWLIKFGDQDRVSVQQRLIYDLKLAEAKIEAGYTENRLKIQNEQPLNRAKIDLLDENAKLKSLEKLDSLIRTTTVGKVDSLRLDSLRYAIDVREESIRRLKLEIDVMSDGLYFTEQQTFLLQRYQAAKAELKAKIPTIAISHINLHWITFGFGVDSDQFTLFTASDTTDNRLASKQYTSRYLQLALSQYRYNAMGKGDIHWSAGVKYSLTNNTSSLSSSTIRKTEGIPGDSLRVAYTEQKVLSGGYKVDLDQLTAYGDYYQFFDLGGIHGMAFHLYPQLLVRDGFKPEVSLHAGFLYPFTDKSDKSVANVELFLRLGDLFHSSETNPGISKSNILGVSASFPVTFFNP